MKKGLFYYLSHIGKTEDAPTPFSKKVFDAIDQMKGKDEAEAKKIAAPLFDSIATMKDSDDKALLLDVVSDCFKAPELTEKNKEKVGSFLDSQFQKVETDTLKDFASMKDGKDGADDKSGDDESAKKKKAEDDEAADKNKKADMKDADDGKGKGTASVSDSALEASIAKIVDSRFEAFDKKMDELISAKLGIKVEKPAGGAVDLKDSSPAATGNYSVSDILDRA